MPARFAARPRPHPPSRARRRARLGRPRAPATPASSTPGGMPASRRNVHAATAEHVLNVHPFRAWCRAIEKGSPSWRIAPSFETTGSSATDLFAPPREEGGGEGGGGGADAHRARSPRSASAQAPARRHPPRHPVRRRERPVRSLSAPRSARPGRVDALASSAAAARGRAPPAERRAERPVDVAGAQDPLGGEPRGGVERLGVEVAADDQTDFSRLTWVVTGCLTGSFCRGARVRLARFLRVPQQPPRLQRADVRGAGVEEQMRVGHHQSPPFVRVAYRLERGDEPHGGDLLQRLAQVRLRRDERRGGPLLGHRAGALQGDNRRVHHAPRRRLHEDAAALSGEPGFLGQRPGGRVPRRAHLRHPERAVPLAVHLLQRHDLGRGQQDVLHRQGEPRARVRRRRGEVRVQRRPGVRVRVRQHVVRHDPRRGGVRGGGRRVGALRDELCHALRRVRSRTRGRRRARRRERRGRAARRVVAAPRYGGRRHRENAPEVRGSGRVHAPGADGHVARGDGAARGVIRAFPRQAEPLVLQVLVLVAVPRADRVRDERRPDGGVPEDSDGLQRRRVDPDAERTHAVHDQRPTAHPRVHVCRLRIQLGSGARLTKRRGRRRRRARARAVAVPLLPGRGLLPRLLDGRAQPRQRLARGLVRGSLQTLRTDRRGQRDFDLYAPSGVETRVRDAGRVGHAGGGAESAREIRSSDASTGGHQAEGRGGGDGGPTELERSSMRHRQPPRRAQHAPD